MDSDRARYALAIFLAFLAAALIKQFLWWLDSLIPPRKGYWRLNSWVGKIVARRANRAGRKKGAVD
jgi:hypothetical protein